MKYTYAWSSRQLHKDDPAVSPLHVPADPHLDFVTNILLVLVAPFSLAVLKLSTYLWPPMPGAASNCLMIMILLYLNGGREKFMVYTLNMV